MKILIVNYEFPPLGGGAAAQTRLLAREFAARGHRTLVITAHYRGMPLYQMCDGCGVLRIPCFRRRKESSCPVQMALFLIMAALPYSLVVWRYRPDIVLSFFLLPTALLGLLSKLIFRIPYIVSLRGGDVHSFLVDELAGWFRHLKPLARLTGRNASQLVAVSHDLAAMTREVFPEFSPLVVQNAVPLPRLTEAPTAESTTLLFVGRLSFEKNLPLALEALAQTPPQRRLEIIGDGPLRSQLEEMTQRLNLSDRVRFHGWQSREYVHAWMQRADFLLLLSKVEGMSMAGLEAYSYGLPIIGSLSPGMRDFVIPGKTGYQVNTDTVDELVALLNELPDCPEETARLRESCRLHIREHHSIDVAAERYLALMAEVIEGEKDR
ncbi:MAG: glycosyltransferase family 4 protein [Candidatus Cloacimonetes bacterium]|nr:glycosyltransferase family 4 protein [Candidatus Cloacimonadota bacterium]